MAYSQVQRGNNFQRGGIIDRDQIEKVRDEKVNAKPNEPIRLLNLSEEQRKSFKEINSKHLSQVK